MGKTKQAKTPEWKLGCFEWLPLSKWSIETTMTDTELYGKKYCKICDLRVGKNDQEKHVKFHIEEQKVINARIAAENAEIARFAREARAIEKALEKAALALTKGKGKG